MTDRPLVLCADDDEDILALVALRLSRAGFEVETVADGEAALEAVRALRPALAVLDVMMPGRSGLDVVAELKADPGLRDVKVVLLSARARTADVDAGLAAGADAYLAKPFRAQDLVETVERLLYVR